MLKPTTQLDNKKMSICKKRDETSAERFRRLTNKRWRIQEKEQLQSGRGCKCNSEKDRSRKSLVEFYQEMQSRSFGISCMVFQDVWNLEIERLKRCCIHVITPTNRMIPFCAFYLTDINGRRLYNNSVISG